MITLKNIVFIMVDQLRADIAYHEKYSFVQTPNIDRLREEGITFFKAFSNYPVCAPARASTLTGRYPQQHGVLNNRCMLPSDERTLGHHLSDLGYDAVAFGKTHGQNPGFRRIPEPPIKESLGSRLWGWYENQSMLEPDSGEVSEPVPVLGVFENLEDHYDSIVARQVDDYLSTYDGNHPFCLFVGFHTPHTPLIPPKEFADLYSAEDIDVPKVSEAMMASKPTMQQIPGKEYRRTPLDTRKQMMAAYLALVTHVDAAIGRVLKTLETNQLSEETVLIFVSDHGEQLGDYGMLGKFNNFYDSSLRIPLVVRLPKQKNTGNQTDALIELVDLFPTICDLIQVPTPRNLAGQSFESVLRNPDRRHRQYVNGLLVEKGAHGATAPGSNQTFVAGRFIRSDRWKLACYSQDQGELYDLENDPIEANNLYDDPDHREIKLELLERMMEHTLCYMRDPSHWGYNHFPG